MGEEDRSTIQDMFLSLMQFLVKGRSFQISPRGDMEGRLGSIRQLLLENNEKDNQRKTNDQATNQSINPSKKWSRLRISSFCTSFGQ
jgi:hypothetical protein